jgi:DNA-binding MarR family transcriptional regulator
MHISEKFKDFPFDVVIPSHLLLNRDIESSAKVFYAIVRNLTNFEGYCYDTNKYLAELMDVDVSTIQKWLRSLERAGYIEVEFESDQSSATRKISIANKYSKK